MFVIFLFMGNHCIEGGMITGPVKVVVQIFVAGVLLCASATGAVRVSDYETALLKAKEMQSDIFVYLHGSDWCRRGEKIKKDVWDAPAFAEVMGEKSVLLSMDFPEQISPKSYAVFEDFLEKKPVAADILELISEKGVEFRAMDDKSMLAVKPNPGNDVYTLKLMAGKKEIKAIYVEALADDSLPNRGPGRASNGNFCLTEVEAGVVQGGVTNKLLISGAWANRTERNFSTAFVFDGDVSSANGWSAEGHRYHEDAAIVLVPDQPIPGGTRFELRLSFLAKWGEHVIGRIRIRFSDEAGLRDAVMELTRVEKLKHKNATFDYTTYNYPAVAVMDSEGRAVLRENGLLIGTTVKDLAARLDKIRKIRIERDDLWKAAETADGRRKAELLGKSLDKLDCRPGNMGHKKVYEKVFEEIKNADPDDLTGYTRKYTFNAGNIAKPAHELATGKKFQDAVDLINNEISSPRNILLTTEQVQQLMFEKFKLYRDWPGQEERKWDVLKAIADKDSTTHTGIGARGYLLQNQKGGVTITYGWWPELFKGGSATWEIDQDTKKYFDHAGPYDVTMEHKKGADTFSVKSISLKVGSRILSTDRHPGTIGSKPVDNKYQVELPEFKPNELVKLCVEIEAAVGIDSTGQFRVDPLLPDPQ